MSLPTDQSRDSRLSSGQTTTPRKPSSSGKPHGRHPPSRPSTAMNQAGPAGHEARHSEVKRNLARSFSRGFPSCTFLYFCLAERGQTTCDTELETLASSLRERTSSSSACGRVHSVPEHESQEAHHTSAEVRYDFSCGTTDHVGGAPNRHGMHYLPREPGRPANTALGFFFEGTDAYANILAMVPAELLGDHLETIGRPTVRSRLSYNIFNHISPCQQSEADLTLFLRDLFWRWIFFRRSSTRPTTTPRPLSPPFSLILQ